MATTDSHDQVGPTVDNGQLQDTGAAGGETTSAPATPPHPLDMTRFLSSARGERERDALDAELEDAHKEADRYRNEREEARRALEEARRRQDRQDALIADLFDQLREIRRERSSEVRESPIRSHARAVDQTEVSGRLESPTGEPVASTPVRGVGFNLDDRPSQGASASAAVGHAKTESSSGIVVGDRSTVPAATPPPPVAPVLLTSVGDVTSSDLGAVSGQSGVNSKGPHLKVGSYDGESDLTAFLHKFDRLASLYKWTAEEQLVALESSLKGAAADIVYEVQPSTTIEDMKNMLKVRFSTDEQGEVSRTELQHTRRQPGEQLQKLYRTIKKLMSVGYPGPSSATKHWIGHDHFLRALNDEPFSVQVSLQRPKTLEETLTAALELEALGVGREGERQRKESLTGLRNESQITGSHQRDRTRSSRAPGAGLAYQVAHSSPDASQLVDVEQLVRAVHSWTAKNDVKSSTVSGTVKIRQKNAAGSEKAQERDESKDRGKSTAVDKRSTATGRRQSFPSNVCLGCQQKGHWAFECPLKKAAMQETGGRQRVPTKECSQPVPNRA